MKTGHDSELKRAHCTQVCPPGSSDEETVRRWSIDRGPKTNGDNPKIRAGSCLTAPKIPIAPATGVFLTAPSRFSGEETVLPRLRWARLIDRQWTVIE